jgi:crotonobetainyl-CoA:carnitine CoA-transferase CaiB-like acyl-CoA transferase
VKNRLELRKLIIEKFQTRTVVEWENLLKAQSIPCNRIQSVAALVQEEQLHALGLLAAFPHPLIPDLRLVDLPVSIDGTRTAQHNPPPLLGEHTDAILTELGYSKDEMAALREKKIIA